VKTDHALLFKQWSLEGHQDVEVSMISSPYQGSSLAITETRSPSSSELNGLALDQPMKQMPILTDEQATANEHALTKLTETLQRKGEKDSEIKSGLAT